MSTTKEEKWVSYAAQISNLLGELFNEDSDHFIDQEELQEEDNVTQFMHALANAVPTTVYNNLTDDNKNMLHFNYMANQLCFQYSKKVD